MKKPRMNRISRTGVVSVPTMPSLLTVYLLIFALVMLSIVSAPAFAANQLTTPVSSQFPLDNKVAITSASEFDYPPFSVVTPDGKADGFSVELLRAVLNATGYDVEFKVGPWSEIKEDLAQGRIQVLPLVGRTPEREDIYDFTVPYISLRGAIFVRRGDARINSLDDLKDKEIIAMEGDNAEEFVRRENVSAKIITTRTFTDAFQLLSDGKHDAIVVQRIVGMQILADSGIDNVVPLDYQINDFRQDFTFAVKEGDSQLLSVLNDGLSMVIADGTYDRLYSRWIDVLIPIIGSASVSGVATNVSVSAADNWSVPSDPISRAKLVVEYDRALTDYSLDYIISGDAYWKGQYDLIGARLDKLIKLAKANAISQESKDLFDRQDKANLALVAIELRAHSLVRDGRREEARTLIESGEYVRWKQIYSDTINEYLETLGIHDTSHMGKESLTELSVHLKALEVANQIDSYLAEHPEKTISALQNDSFFGSLAVQKVGNAGYTILVDSSSGMIYFHPQRQLINQDAHQFTTSLPDFVAIFEKSLGPTCSESSGSYDWREVDGTLSKKYMYIACVKSRTADGKPVFVTATTYLDELEASHYLSIYKVGEFSTFAQDAIKQKAVDVAKQLEIYIKAHPDMTVADLQNDSYFREIAVQLVGKTGYTAVADTNTLTNRFHKNPQIVNLDLITLADKLPGFVRIVSKTRGGFEAEGIYDWQETDGSITQKYMYIAIVNALTADGVRFNVAATTYLDEYLPGSDFKQNVSAQDVSATKGINMTQSLAGWLFSFIGVLLFIFLLLFILQKTKVIILEANVIFYMISIVAILIIGVFLLNTYQVTSNLRDQTINSFKAQQLLLARQTANMMQTNLEFILKDAGVTSTNPDLLGDRYTRRSVLERMHDRLDFSSDGLHIALVARNGSVMDESPVLDVQNNMMSDHQALVSAGYFSILDNVFASGRVGMSGIMPTGSSRQAVIFLLPVYGNNRLVEYALQVTLFIDQPFLDAFSQSLNLTGESHIHLIIGNVSFAGLEIPGEREFFQDPSHVELIKMIDAGVAGASEHEHMLLLDGVASTKQVISAYASVNVLDQRWGVTLETPRNAAYASIAQSIGRVWIFTVTLILVTLIGGMFAVIFLTDHLRREINNKTREVYDINRNLESTVKQRTAELEKLNVELESRVAGRTAELNSKVKELTDTRTAILNILEDVNASKDEIEKSHDSLLKLNKEMKKANAELMRMDNYKNEFISVTAHELKTPLASIHGFAGLLQSKKILSQPKQRDYYLNIIMQDADRLKKLIDDILDLSRLDLGTMKFVFDNVSVREVIKDVVKEMYMIAANKGLMLKASVADDVPQGLVADKSRLHQVLINLVNNAVKYTDKKGRKIIIGVTRQGSHVLFSVKDEGVGIAKADYPKLFQRFSQIDSSYTRKVGGSGLGLAISKGIVNALGGKIWLKSVLDKGTTFYFTLPVKSKAKGASEAELSVLGGPDANGKASPENLPAKDSGSGAGSRETGGKQKRSRK